MRERKGSPKPDRVPAGHKEGNRLGRFRMKTRRARISGRKAGQRARTARSRFLSSLEKHADPASSSEKCFRRGDGAIECLRPGKNTSVIPLQHRDLPRDRRRPAEPRPQKIGPPDSGKGQARPVFLSS